MNYRHLLLAAALGIVTSCVPAEGGIRIARTQPPRIVDSRALLSALALQAPADPLPQATADVGRFAEPVGSAPPFLASVRSTDDADRAADCLTQAVYYEARSEPLDGQRAVAQVVLNRVRDRAFPHSVCGVVYQHPAHKAGCQFTFTCDGSMNGTREPRAWDRARAVAIAALSGSVYAPVGPAVFYHTQAVSPWWAPSLSRIGAIGSHIFYRWHDALARSLSFHQDYSGLEPVAVRSIAAAIPATFTADLERQSGVTVHRASAAMSATAESGGVRIHRGIIPPHLLDEAADAVDGEPDDRT